MNNGENANIAIEDSTRIRLYIEKTGTYNNITYDAMILYMGFVDGDIVIQGRRNNQGNNVRTARYILNNYQDFTTRKVSVTGRKQTSQATSISAPTVDGFEFVTWYHVATEGGVGSCYIQEPFSSSTQIGVAYSAFTGTSTGQINAYCLYRRKFSN